MRVPEPGLPVVVGEQLDELERSSLWDPERYVEREELPSSGEILRSLHPGFDAASYDAKRAERYARREGFY